MPDQEALPDDNASPQVADDCFCVACRYPLRGLLVEGDCPECGVSIAQSVAASRRLTRRDLTVIAIRLLMLWIVITNLPAFIQSVLIIVGSVFIMGDDYWIYQVMLLTAMLILLAAAILVWFLAPKIARVAFGADAAIGSSIRLTRGSLLAIGMVLLGIYFTVEGAAGAADFPIDAWLDMHWPEIQWQSPSAYSFIQLIAGIVLLLRAPAIARNWSRRLRDL